MPRAALLPQASYDWQRFVTWLPWLWLAGALGDGNTRARRQRAALVDRAAPATARRFGPQELLAECADVMRVRRRPAMLAADHLRGPALAGCVRPVLLVRAACWARSPAQTSAECSFTSSATSVARRRDQLGDGRRRRRPLVQPGHRLVAAPSPG